MRFICDNIAGIYIAAVAGLMAWVFGGTRSELLEPLVPWLMLFMAEIILFFPQKRMGESSYMARQRAWYAMRGDPLVWTALGFLALLLIPFLNNGLCPLCDAAQIAEGVNPKPPLPFLPFCVNRVHHLNVVLWFVTALSCMIATKHCLAKHGQRTLLEMIVWNGAVLAVFGFIESAADAPGPFWVPLENGRHASDFFSSFGYPNMGGDYFTTLFGLSAALWRWRHEEVRNEVMTSGGDAIKGRRGRFWRKNYLLLPAGLCFFAALNTLSRASIMLVTFLAVLMFLHTFVTFLSRLDRARRVKRGAVSLLLLGVITFSATIFMPDDMQREVDTIDTAAVLDRVTGKGYYHVRVATALWKDHVLFGCGGWGYRHLSVPKMTDEEFKDLQTVGGINVHNDYLQFLAEHGLVGFGALVTLVILLLMPVCSAWRELASAVRFVKSRNRPPRPVSLFVLPAPVFFILLTAIATVIHGFGDCPFRSPAVLTLFFIELAAMPAFLPKLIHHHHS